MFSKTYKYIGMVIITLVLLGHHSFQAYAMEVPHHHAEEVSCVGHDCHHDVNMEICEKIQSDEMQVSTDTLFLMEESICIYFTIDTKQALPSSREADYLENIPISHKQLARSHL